MELTIINAVYIVTRPKQKLFFFRYFCAIQRVPIVAPLKRDFAYNSLFTWNFIGFELIKISSLICYSVDIVVLGLRHKFI